MAPTSKLNVLLTYPPRQRQRRYETYEGLGWPEIVSQLLAPAYVQTYVATTGQEALDLADHHAMHVAVLDTGLAGEEGSGLGAISVARLIQHLESAARDKLERRHPWPHTADLSADDDVTSAWSHAGGRRIPVTGSTDDAKPQQDGRRRHAPLVILLAPPGSAQLMREALQYNVFSVVPQPLDVNRLLAVMARALQRVYGDHWPS